MSGEQKILSVSALAADVHNLGRDFNRLHEAGIQYLHFDLMDGQFCPDVTVGPWFVRSVETQMQKDVHLMVSDPENWIAPCLTGGAAMITVHLESGTHAHRALELVSELDTSHVPPARGVGICPGTPLGALEPFLDVVDFVLVLGINPGWRQPMLPGTAERVLGVREIVSGCGRIIRVGLDGGVTLDSLDLIARAQPDMLVSGSAVFANSNIEQNVDSFTSALNQST